MRPGLLATRSAGSPVRKRPDDPDTDASLVERVAAFLRDAVVDLRARTERTFELEIDATAELHRKTRLCETRLGKTLHAGESLDERPRMLPGAKPESYAAEQRVQARR